MVLLDLGLPDSHGIDTLVVTRAQAPGVPIVVLTGFQDEALGDEALKGGAQDYLVKGQVDSKLLGRSLRYAIVRKATEEALLRQGVASPGRRNCSARDSGLWRRRSAFAGKPPPNCMMACRKSS